MTSVVEEIRQTEINWTKTAHWPGDNAYTCAPPSYGSGLSTGPTEGLSLWWLTNRSYANRQQQFLLLFPYYHYYNFLYFLFTTCTSAILINGAYFVVLTTSTSGTAAIGTFDCSPVWLSAAGSAPVAFGTCIQNREKYVHSRQHHATEMGLILHTSFPTTIEPHFK